ncbi:MAG TPA: type II toxin-antitoxin system RelE/ParE family toxin [Candidatus Nanoarchaeia archaeon]|nr:type II toxin-antitoxin system RelE/ParE family toxin [Candidatus Nanoarchaeia archaeon]
MYDIVYSPKALKALEKLDKNIQERIINAVERLRIRPESYDIKKLVGMTGYRFRVGDYRVLIDIYKNRLLILVLKIGHRKNIYD